MGGRHRQGQGWGGGTPRGDANDCGLLRLGPPDRFGLGPRTHRAARCAGAKPSPPPWRSGEAPAAIKSRATDAIPHLESHAGTRQLDNPMPGREGHW